MKAWQKMVQSISFVTKNISRLYRSLKTCFTKARVINTLPKYRFCLDGIITVQTQSGVVLLNL
jgi:DNA-binding winged helix-turn-helix (wHTH) protein